MIWGFQMTARYAANKQIHWKMRTNIRGGRYSNIFKYPKYSSHYVSDGSSICSKQTNPLEEIWRYEDMRIWGYDDLRISDGSAICSKQANPLEDANEYSRWKIFEYIQISEIFVTLCFRWQHDMQQTNKSTGRNLKPPSEGFLTGLTALQAGWKNGGKLFISTLNYPIVYPIPSHPIST